MSHHATDAVRLREQATRLSDITAHDKLSHARTRNDRAVENDRLDHLQLNALGGRVLPQRFDIPFAIVAEKEVRSFDNRLGMERFANDSIEEFARTQRQQGLIRGISNHAVDAEFVEQLRFSLGPRERRRRGRWPQKPHRMRIEREHNCWPTNASGVFDESLDEPCVAAMHAVEVANRERTEPIVSGTASRWRMTFIGPLIIFAQVATVKPRGLCYPWGRTATLPRKRADGR